MEFKNKNIAKMKDQKARYNRQFSNWYYGMHQENGGDISCLVDENGSISWQATAGEGGLRYFNRGDRIASCMDFWVWDKYEKNKLLDLQRVNRCKNSRFCPNCKMLNVARFIQEFKKQFPNLVDKYDFYMATFTVPSVPADDNGSILRDTLDKLNYTFKYFSIKYNRPLLTPTGRVAKNAFQSRYATIYGGVRVLEITYNDKGFHPHFHVILLLPKDVDVGLFEKKYIGKYSNKRKSYNMKSDFDIQISKVWTLLWYGKYSQRNYDSFEYNPAEEYAVFDGDKSDSIKNLECDITPLDDGGIYEVFKYTFKSSEIEDYKVFKNLVYAMENRRIRQGFGELYNMKCDGDEEGEAQPLDLAITEEPQKLLLNEFDDLLTTYADYRKVSRFNKGTELDEFSSIITD